MAATLPSLPPELLIEVFRGLPPTPGWPSAGNSGSCITTTRGR